MPIFDEKNHKVESVNYLKSLHKIRELIFKIVVNNNIREFYNN